MCILSMLKSRSNKSRDKTQSSDVFGAGLNGDRWLAACSLTSTAILNNCTPRRRRLRPACTVYMLHGCLSCIHAQCLSQPPFTDAQWCLLCHIRMTYIQVHQRNNRSRQTCQIHPPLSSRLPIHYLLMLPHLRLLHGPLRPQRPRNLDPSWRLQKQQSLSYVIHKSRSTILGIWYFSLDTRGSPSSEGPAYKSHTSTHPNWCTQQGLCWVIIPPRLCWETGEVRRGCGARRSESINW